MEVFSVLCLLVFSHIAADASIRVERAVSCPRITDFSGRVKYRRKGTRAVFKCPKKLTRHGVKFATCRMDGTWSDESPLCIKTGCVPLDASLITNLDMNVVNGAVVEFSCLADYLLIGETQAYCNGKDWSAPLPRCAAPHELTECDFEQDLCGWVQDDTDDQDWIRNVGPTQTGNTGPKHDHTYGDTRSGHYLFFETSNPTMTGHQAILISPTYTADMSPMCFDFWYHILGPDEAGHVGSLAVFILDNSQFIDDDGIQSVFTKEGNQGDSWHRGEIFIDTQVESYQIYMIATRALSYISDIAIDDLRLYNCSSTTPRSVTTTSTTTLPTTTTTTAPTTITTRSRTTTPSPMSTTTSTTKPSSTVSTTAMYQSSSVTVTAPTTKAAVISSSTSSTASTITATAKPISSITTSSKQSVVSSQVSIRSSSTSSSAAPTALSTFSQQWSSRAESRGPNHTKSAHDATTQSAAAAATTTGLSVATTTMKSAKTTAKSTTPSSTSMTTTTAITSPSSSSPSVRSSGPSRKSTAASASSTVILSLTTSTPTAQPESKSTTQASKESSSVTTTTKSSILSTLSTDYPEIMTGLSTMTSTTTTPITPTVTSASTKRKTGHTTISQTTYTHTSTIEKLSTSSINEQTTTIKQYPTHTTQAIKSTKSTTAVPTKSPAKSTKRTNALTTKSPAKSTKRSNALTTKSPAKSTKRTNALTTKRPAKSTKRTHALTTKAQIATSTTKSNSISVSQQRPQHPADDTIKPLMIGLCVGILTGLIVIGVVAYVWVRRRKFYTSRYEDELKPFTNSGSNQSLNNGTYYQDEESES